MNFDVSDELKQLRDEARRFLDADAERLPGLPRDPLVDKRTPARDIPTGARR